MSLAAASSVRPSVPPCLRPSVCLSAATTAVLPRCQDADQIFTLKLAEVVALETRFMQTWFGFQSSGNRAALGSELRELEM